MHPCLCLLCLILIACCMPEIDGFISGKVVKLSGISSGGNVPGSLQPSTVLQTQLHHHRIHSSISMSNNVEDTTTITLQENASMWDKFQAAGKVLYKFSRPHTIKGTILASTMGVLRALLENPQKINFNLIPRACIGLIALLCGNAYIVGINQIYDVKIDEINKPFLPIAAKTLTERNAWLIVVTCLISGVSIVKNVFSKEIFALYMTGIVLGTLYSVPPVQLKKIPFFAGSTIAIVRGFLLNFGVYYAVREALQVSFKWNPVVVFISSFMTVFASVIAITKDLPDIEGDRKYSIVTLASTLGARPVAKFATMLLSAAYGVAIILPAILRGRFNGLPMVLGHSAALAYLARSYFQLQAEDPLSIKKFYKSIWNLFYFQYIIYPMI